MIILLTLLVKLTYNEKSWEAISGSANSTSWKTGTKWHYVYTLWQYNYFITQIINTLIQKVIIITYALFKQPNSLFPKKHNAVLFL